MNLSRMLGGDRYQAASDNTPKAEPDLEALAVAMVPDIVAQQPKRLAAFRAAHRWDVASYSFECRRFGDFLSVYIARGGEKHAGAINLSLVKEVTVEAGHGPDRAATATFDHYYDRSKVYVIQPMPRTGSGPMIYVPQDPQGGAQNGYGYYGQRKEPHIETTVPNVARPALSDQIHLLGSGVVIYAPFGEGSKVYEQILVAMAAARRVSK